MSQTEKLSDFHIAQILWYNHLVHNSACGTKFHLVPPKSVQVRPGVCEAGSHPHPIPKPRQMALMALVLHFTSIHRLSISNRERDVGDMLVEVIILELLYGMVPTCTDSIKRAPCGHRNENMTSKSVHLNQIFKAAKFKCPNYTNTWYKMRLSPSDTSSMQTHALNMPMIKHQTKFIVEKVNHKVSLVEALIL